MGVGVFLQSYGFAGGNIGNLLYNLEQLGFFAYALPFLIIFAIVFGIISKTNLFGDNKAIGAIIAISVGLMALQFGLVSSFFSELFPRFGIGLSVLLVIMILLGLFKKDDDEKWQNYVMLFIGAIIVIAVLVQSAGGTGSYFGYSVQNNWPSILAIVVLGVAVIAVIASSGRNSSKKKGFTVYPDGHR